MRHSALIFSTLTLLLLGGLFYLFRPAAPAYSQGSSLSAGPGENTVENAVEAATHSQPPLHTVTVRIANGRRAEGPAVIRIQQGDTLVLRLRSDRNAELHLHGYDLHAQLSADTVVELAFTADHSGRFEYELHGHHPGEHQALGAIEVLPR